MTNEWDGMGLPKQDFHPVKAECVRRTAEALAEGHQMAKELELKILEMRHEREVQLTELGGHIASLEKDLALLAQNVGALVVSVKTNHDEIVEVRALAVSSEKRITSMENWQVQESARRQNEEENAKARIKPWQEVLWTVVKTAAVFILGIIASAVWAQYFVK